MYLFVCSCGYSWSIQLSNVLNEASKDAFYMRTLIIIIIIMTDVSYSFKEACNMKRSGTQVNEREKIQADRNSRSHLVVSIIAWQKLKFMSRESIYGTGLDMAASCHSEIQAMFKFYIK